MPSRREHLAAEIQRCKELTPRYGRPMEGVCNIPTVRCLEGKEVHGVVTAQIVREKVRVGDVVYGVVKNAEVRLCGMAGWDVETKKLRQYEWGCELDALHMKLKMLREEEDTIRRRYDDGDYIRGVLVRKEDMLVTINSATAFGKHSSRAVPLGRCNEYEVRADDPPHSTPLRVAWWGGDKTIDVTEAMLKDRALQNPYGAATMAECLGVDLGSMCTRLTSTPRQSYRELRREQHVAYSDENVVKGVRLTKMGNCKEAINHYNQAISYNPENADAFVGRGAAHANMSNFTEAIKDFKAALRQDPDHKNAVKYLSACQKKLSSASNPPAPKPPPPPKENTARTAILAALGGYSSSESSRGRDKQRRKKEKRSKSHQSDRKSKRRK